MKYKYIFFDVANTLLYKPKLYNSILTSLKSYGINVSKDFLIKRHRILSETVTLPDKTSYEFYKYFNKELLYSLGILPSEELIKSIYEKCINLNWEKFSDTDVLKQLNIDLGAISNWDKTLTKKLKEFFDLKFKNILVSSEAKSRKPNLEIFKSALVQVDLPANQILFVGDSIKDDIESAMLIGFKPVLIDRDNLYPYFNGLKIRNLYKLKDIISGSAST